MLFPEPLLRVLIVADKTLLVRLVHVLQTLGCIHFSSIPTEGEEGIQPAKPHTFFPVEGYLVALRSIKEFLRVTPPTKWEPIPEGELLITLPEQMEILSQKAHALREEMDRIQTRLREVYRTMKEIIPFVGCEIDVSLLHGYTSLRIVMASVGALPPTPIPHVELTTFHAPSKRTTKILRHTPVADATLGMDFGGSPLRLFAVEAKDEEAFRAFLSEHGARFLSLPESVKGGKGGETLMKFLAERTALERSLREIDAKRAALAEEWRLFLFAAEEVLVSLLSKNLGTTHFVVSKYAAATRVWIRERDFPRFRQAIEEHFPKGVGFEIEKEREVPHAEPSSALKKKEIAPTSLPDRPWCRPFLMLTEMFDIPRYNEVDPTPMLGLFFPLFFGFMVGDAGYGALMTLGAILLLRLCGARPDRKLIHDLAQILFIGGLVSVFFGTFVFADAFGIPFHQEGEAVFWWTRWIPWLPSAILLKSEGPSVNAMLTLSILAGWLHMGLGCLFGVLNQLHHSLRHVLHRVGQFLVISALSLLIVNLDAFRGGRFGQALWDTLLLPIAALGPGNVILFSLAVGMLFILIGEGPAGILGLFELFGNVISFTRLALVGVSKAAVAIAVNTVLLPMILEGRSLLLAGVLFLLLSLAHLLLVVLGCLSASIQSVRLHYCETFSKFFMGGGVRFTPFGLHRVFTRA